MRKYIDAEVMINELRELRTKYLIQSVFGEDMRDNAVIAGALGAVAQILDGLPAADIPRWIPVTERLPEAYGRYLVTLEHEDYIRVMPLYYGRINRKDTFYDSANEYGDIKCRRVIAWMPFPEPYKGGDETKHGEWKIDGFEDLDDGTSQMIVRCSVCGNTQGVLTNYCPNCGAKMDEVEE